jgi:cold shock CspA family protein
VPKKAQNEGMQRFAGRLKFFDENKNYGFLVMENDGSDIFGI